MECSDKLLRHPYQVPPHRPTQRRKPRAHWENDGHVRTRWSLDPIIHSSSQREKMEHVNPATHDKSR
ncbi:hypothetical protein PM082_011520 [Marasmius tenuissimus]|nr:hypothetical protein PM082_011520 [Marasmius tenuissimus]